MGGSKRCRRKSRSSRKLQRVRGVFLYLPVVHIGKIGISLRRGFPRYDQGFRAGRAVYPNTAMRRSLRVEQHILRDGSEIKIWQANAGRGRPSQGCKDSQVMTNGLGGFGLFD